MVTDTAPKKSWLSPEQRIFFVFVNLIFGLLPSLVFFAWVERNASLPYIGLDLGWPWIDLQSWPTPALAAWDASLFFMFGVFHSLLAQSFIQKKLGTWIPAQAVRTFYLAFTGVSLIALMGFWQNTGVVFWVAPFRPSIVNGLSLVLFWGTWLLAGWVMTRFDALEFVGLKQLYSRAESVGRSEGMPRLDTQGIYSAIRHPIYTLTTLAFLLTPFMTLDRAILTGAMSLYLIFAIPIEERKLIAIFGQAYEDYRRRVPAVVPRISRLLG